jgi:SAM-dependent methyltransferase
MPQDLTPQFFPESRFGGFTRLDGTLAFYSRVNALLRPDMQVVDFGCGRGAYAADPVEFRRRLRILRGKVHKVIGLDASPAGDKNPFIDEFHQFSGECWPLADSSMGLVLCDNVLEHLPDPEIFFREAYRVLEPGGYVCIRTPNAWNYVAILSRIIPGRAHASVLNRVKSQIADEDVFPTLYRCNSLPAVRHALREAGFDGTVNGYEAEPVYLSFSRLAYVLGLLHQRLAPNIFKASIFAFAEKKSPK